MLRYEKLLNITADMNKEFRGHVTCSYFELLALTARCSKNTLSACSGSTLVLHLPCALHQCSIARRIGMLWFSGISSSLVRLCHLAQAPFFCFCCLGCVDGIEQSGIQIPDLPGNDVPQHVHLCLRWCSWNLKAKLHPSLHAHISKKNMQAHSWQQQFMKALDNYIENDSSITIIQQEGLDLKADSSNWLFDWAKGDMNDKDYEELRRFFNGNLANEQCLEHRCNARCCRNKEETRSKALRLLRSMLLPFPAVPLLYRWKHWSPALCWATRASMIHGLIVKVLDRMTQVALGALCVARLFCSVVALQTHVWRKNMTPCKAEVGSDCASDCEFREDSNFSTIQGVRARKTVACLVKHMSFNYIWFEDCVITATTWRNQ